jgi:hypothetical protein
MPATSPPSLPPPPSPPPPASPPSSSQLHQQAVRNQERLQRDVGSPELRRIPGASTTLSTIFSPFPPPPLPSVSAPVTFNGQSFNHLPPHIVAGMRNLQPFPVLARRGRRANSTHPPLPPPQVMTPDQLAAAHAILPPFSNFRMQSIVSFLFYLLYVYNILISY